MPETEKCFSNQRTRKCYRYFRFSDGAVRNRADHQQYRFLCQDHRLGLYLCSACAMSFDGGTLLFPISAISLGMC